MRALLLFPLFLTACPNELLEVCGLPNSQPEVERGRLTATLDGEAFAEDALWKPGSDADIVAGLLIMSIAKDETGTDLDDLLLDNALPICVPLRDRSETSGNANFTDDVTSYVSDEAHTGGVAIIALDGDELIGRFAVDVVNAGQGLERSFSEGEFRALRRE